MQNKKMFDLENEGQAYSQWRCSMANIHLCKIHMTHFCVSSYLSNFKFFTSENLCQGLGVQNSQWPHSTANINLYKAMPGIFRYLSPFLIYSHLKIHDLEIECQRHDIQHLQWMIQLDIVPRFPWGGGCIPFYRNGNGITLFRFAAFKTNAKLETCDAFLDFSKSSRDGRESTQFHRRYSDFDKHSRRRRVFISSAALCLLRVSSCLIQPLLDVRDVSPAAVQSFLHRPFTHSPVFLSTSLSQTTDDLPGDSPIYFRNDIRMPAAGRLMHISEIDINFSVAEILCRNVIAIDFRSSVLAIRDPRVLAGRGGGTVTIFRPSAGCCCGGCGGFGCRKNKRCLLTSLQS